VYFIWREVSSRIVFLMGTTPPLPVGESDIAQSDACMHASPSLSLATQPLQSAIVGERDIVQSDACIRISFSLSRYPALTKCDSRRE